MSKQALNGILQGLYMMVCFPVHGLAGNAQKSQVFSLITGGPEHRSVVVTGFPFVVFKPNFNNDCFPASGIALACIAL